MITKDVRLNFGRKEICTLIWTGDWHLGCASCNLDGLDCLHDRVMSNGIQFIHAADAVDAICAGDKRYSIAEKQDTLIDQMDTAVERLKKMKKYCLGMLEGNHEGVASKLVGPISHSMCKRAEIDFLTQTCFLKLKAPHGQCVTFARHHIQSITNNNPDPLVREAARISRLRKLSTWHEAAVKLGAHIHTFLCHPATSEDRLTLTEKNEVKKRAVMVNPEWIVICPAMFTTYTEESNYSQGRSYRMTDIGWAELDFNRKGEVIEVRNVLADGTTKCAYRSKLVD